MRCALALVLAAMVALSVTVAAQEVPDAGWCEDFLVLMAVSKADRSGDPQGGRRVHADEVEACTAALERLGRLPAGTTPAAPTPGIEPTALTSFGDGFHVICEDIDPGHYATRGPTGCYWAIIPNDPGEVVDIVAFIRQGDARPFDVTIEPRDGFFDTHGCGLWQLVS